MEHKKIDLTMNTDTVHQILVGFIHSEITRVGFSRAVVNLSGGLDSSLSCYLAAEAMGAENVLALRLPYKSSTPDSLEHAQMVIEALGVQSLTIPITDMVDGLVRQFPAMSQIRQGNIMARARMIALYDQSEAFHGLAVGTGNKTEILLGYTTLFGDSACAINPLGDLYKTQVRQLASAMGIPQVIIDKPPSAELRPDQKDQDTLPPYEILDGILELYVEHHLSPDEIISRGFEEATVRWVQRRVDLNEWKRHQAAPGLRVTSKAFGIGRRMPIVQRFIG